jgi:hypothetical protein
MKLKFYQTYGRISVIIDGILSANFKYIVIITEDKPVILTVCD